MKYGIYAGDRLCEFDKRENLAERIQIIRGLYLDPENVWVGKIYANGNVVRIEDERILDKWRDMK